VPYVANESQVHDICQNVIFKKISTSCKFLLSYATA